MTHCTGRPAEQLLESYLQGALNDAEAQGFEEHFFDCPVCLAQVEALQAVTHRLAKEPRLQSRKPIAWPVPPRLWGAIAATLVCGFIGLCAWHPWTLPADHSAHAWSAMLHLSAVRQTPSTILRDGDLLLSLDANGQLHGAEGLSQDARDGLKAALASGRMEVSLPGNFADGQKETMLGASVPAAPFTLLSPIHRVVVEDTPSFTWRALPASTGYRVRIYADGYRKVAESPLLHATDWQSTAALMRGARYTWTVTAEGPHGEVREPAPPQPEAEFLVLNTEAATELEEAERNHGQDHLLLAILYARSGAIDEARAQVDLFTAQNPESKLAAQLKASVHQDVPSPIKTKAAQ